MGDPTHTPGPWVVNRDRRGAGKLYVREARIAEVAGATAGRAVAHVTAVVGSDEQLGNACLVAAAPEMLEALRLALAEHGRSVLFGSITLDAMERAIAKAEGRDDG